MQQNNSIRFNTCESVLVITLSVPSADSQDGRGFVLQSGNFLTTWDCGLVTGARLCHTCCHCSSDRWAASRSGCLRAQGDVSSRLSETLFIRSTLRWETGDDGRGRTRQSFDGSEGHWGLVRTHVHDFLSSQTWCAPSWRFGHPQGLSDIVPSQGIAISDWNGAACKLLATISVFSILVSVACQGNHSASCLIVKLQCLLLSERESNQM